MPFKPGQCGNPGGKSKIVAEELARFRRSQDLKALRERLMQIALQGDDRDAIAAIKEWHDRAYGKAPQAITGDDGGPVQIGISADALALLKKYAGEP